MQYTLATLALVASARFVAAQGVTALLTPTASAPAGCATDYSGTFEITVVKPAAKRDIIQKRACASSGTAVLSLAGSVLTDAKGRIGSIVANHQFQFDGPPAQAGAIYTGGFSVCGNGSLALGGSAVFYQCKSGDFYNLYDNADNGALCQEILIDIMPCGTVAQGGDGQPTAGAAPAATQAGDGQPQVSSAVTQISDGQIQASSAVPAPVSQISDGQVQASGAPVSQISDGQIQASGAPVSQISDGQIQVQPTPPPAPAPVSQISDGQVQATSAMPAPVSQISDGQVQATSAMPAPVSQISDGQVQASSAAPVSQISDGQVQATTFATGAPVSQISDGQVQATSASTAPAAVFTGAAAPLTGSWAAAAVIGLGAIVML